jgi:hypothetical protein
LPKEALTTKRQVVPWAARDLLSSAPSQLRVRAELQRDRNQI